MVVKKVVSKKTPVKKVVSKKPPVLLSGEVSFSVGKPTLKAKTPVKKVVSKKTPVKKPVKVTKKPTLKAKIPVKKQVVKTAPCPIDKDGYININLKTTSGVRGIRLLFERIENYKKKEVALQIDR